MNIFQSEKLNEITNNCSINDYFFYNRLFGGPVFTKWKGKRSRKKRLFPCESQILITNTFVRFRFRLVWTGLKMSEKRKFMKSVSKEINKRHALFHLLETAQHENLLFVSEKQHSIVLLGAWEIIKSYKLLSTNCTQCGAINLSPISNPRVAFPPDSSRQHKLDRFLLIIYSGGVLKCLQNVKDPLNPSQGTRIPADILLTKYNLVLFSFWVIIMDNHFQG